MIIAQDINSWFQFNNVNRIIIFNQGEDYEQFSNFLSQTKEQVYKQIKDNKINKEEIKHFIQIITILETTQKKLSISNKIELSLEERQVILSMLFMQKAMIEESILENKKYLTTKQKIIHNKAGKVEKIVGIIFGVYLFFCIKERIKRIGFTFLLEYLKRKNKKLSILIKYLK